MNLYKISQDANYNYDTFDSAVVCAENEEIARKTQVPAVLAGPPPMMTTTFHFDGAHHLPG